MFLKRVVVLYRLGCFSNKYVKISVRENLNIKWHARFDNGVYGVSSLIFDVIAVNDPRRIVYSKEGGVDIFNI